uniref:Uncharacterized protein n=1 Tax=Anguilla anguilla TaxID=7936 RepID=A0A0E9X3I4_ANGAN
MLKSSRCSTALSRFSFLSEISSATDPSVCFRLLSWCVQHCIVGTRVVQGCVRRVTLAWLGDALVFWLCIGLLWISGINGSCQHRAKEKLARGASKSKRKESKRKYNHNDRESFSTDPRRSKKRLNHR